VRRLLLALAAAAVTVAGCTGVPSHSAPQTVQHLGATTVQQPAPQPQPGSDPRTLVLDFLQANEADAINHGAARAFLAGRALQWPDTTATIIASAHVALTSAHTVTVTGPAVGTLSANGSYKPEQTGDGQGGETYTATYTVQDVGGQNRITGLLAGLLLTTAQFQAVFQQRVVYFYDANEHYLVPDVRYTAVGDPQTVALWLLNQLAAGPRPELQNAETNLEFPAQADAGKVTVKVGSKVTKIEIPGAAQIGAQHRNRLAAQLALTLDQALTGATMQITDNGHPVSVPALHGTEFTAADFGAATGPPSVAPEVYFVRDGAVFDGSGRALRGPLGRGSYGLSSVALARLPGRAALYVAGTTGSGAEQRLLVGTDGALRATPVRGRLTRPSWMPGLDEVWISTGTRLYRVSSGGQVVAVPLAGLPADGVITALRTSPDASRVAMVVSEKGTLQVYVATVARNGSDVRIEAATPITPVGVQVTDVAWNDPLKLFLIGTTAAGGEVVEVQSDGSAWATHNIDDLPQTPDSITVTQREPAWVSSGGEVWVQSGSSWVSPTKAGDTAGGAPVYLE
jgi:hypothetical protein